MHELTIDEIDAVSGGIDWSRVAVGASIVALGIAFVVAAPLTGVAVGLIFSSAATAGEIGVALTSLGLAAVGGFAAGTAFNARWWERYGC